MKKFYTLLLFIIGSQQPLFAENPVYEKHADIRQQVTEFLNTASANLNGDITVSVNNIDQRLRLRKCPSRIGITATSGTVKAGRNTIQVSCLSDTPWRIFITGQVQVLRKILLTSVPISKGHMITASDIKIKKMDISKIPINYFQDKTLVINKIAKRNIRAGSVLNANILTVPLLIKRGDNVSIIAANNGFTITMKGIAMANGSKGDNIKVKNIRTKKIIQGVIINKHSVKVRI